MKSRGAELEMKRIAIRGTGSYVPTHVMTNFDLEKILDTNDEWIYKRTGIKERRIAARDEDASDLAKEASLKAMEMAGISAQDLDLIIMATMTPDTACPAGSNWLEAKLGAHRAVSFDVLAACSGFIFALSVAEQYLRRGTYRNSLVVASEIMSRTLDWTDWTRLIPVKTSTRSCRFTSTPMAQGGKTSSCQGEVRGQLPSPTKAWTRSSII
jgi:3-oxoacyl-[acyl-carrier-protein] synthase-3